MTANQVAEPFLRDVVEGVNASLPPEGWDTHPAGSVAGRRVELAFDPLRHDVAFVWDSCLPDTVTDGMATCGWQQLVQTDDAQVWVRDREVPSRAHGRATRELRVGGGLAR